MALTTVTSHCQRSESVLTCGRRHTPIIPPWLPADVDTGVQSRPSDQDGDDGEDDDGSHVGYPTVGIGRQSLMLRIRHAAWLPEKIPRVRKEEEGMGQFAYMGRVKRTRPCGVSSMHVGWRARLAQEQAE